MTERDPASASSWANTFLPPLGLRLVVWYALTFTVVVTALVTIWALVGGASERDAFDARLLRSAHVIREQIGADEGWDDTQLHDLVAASRDLLYAEIDDAAGRTMRTSNAALAAELPSLEPDGHHVGAAFRDLALEGAEAGRDADSVVRHAILATRAPGGAPLFVHVIARETPDALVWTRLLELLGFLVPAVLIASLIVSALLVRKALGPLGKIRRMARSLGPRRPEPATEDVESGDDLAGLQLELAQARRRIDEAFEAQGRFISNVSHELKTPVSVLLTQAQVLDPATAPRADFARFKRSVQGEMRRLGKLIESFLVLARSSHGGQNIRKETVALMDVFLESVQHCGGYAQQHGVRLVPQLELADVGHPPTLRGDPDLLRTMLDNLVRNAIRFTPRNGTVELRLDTTRERARISITDHGPGLPEGALESLFDPFVQSPDGSPRSGGVGLGLSIAANVAGLHEGRIDAENGTDGGCTFVVDLPLGRAAPVGRETGSDD